MISSGLGEQGAPKTPLVWCRWPALISGIYGWQGIHKLAASSRLKDLLASCSTTGLHPVSPGIHLLCCVDAGGRSRGVFSSASGCDLAGADLRLLSLVALQTFKRRLFKSFPSNRGCCSRYQRISLRIQITPRCALVLGSTRDRAVNDKLSWRWLFSRLASIAANRPAWRMFDRSFPCMRYRKTL